MKNQNLIAIPSDIGEIIATARSRANSAQRARIKRIEASAQLERKIHPDNLDFLRAVSVKRNDTGRLQPHIMGW